jgi:hypothetical protein
MAEKGGFGFETEANRLQKKYEQLFAKTEKTEAEWFSLRQDITVFVTFLDKQVEQNLSNIVGLPLFALKHTLIAQALICDTAILTVGLEKRMAALEKSMAELLQRLR